ncbi:hypothetical protein GWO43_24570 [candidate division KSB1 bacterium]|nr:hypothetical protein [candidate division KSB1 bacterium]NIR68540.1 hypothetical protein [candidate division KSB1 bacterium]NIS27106.1 hypothetical protein [candidate division KSB1 bacterium]NIT73991.1 hypothetical protein [candidate division KSB1 bacterium]NIU27850.1 hypothetical protein [candidate division KSB1 bacterium]
MIKIEKAILCVLLISNALLAQQQKWLSGEVVKLDENGQRVAEVGVTVTVKETRNSDRTDANGLFRIALPGYYKAGEKITLRVEKPGFAIQYPLDGEVLIPADLKKTLVEVRLLPVRSKLFWTHDRIEKFIEDLAEKAKQQVTPEGKPDKIEFGPLIREWASKYGFSVAEAQAEIDKWIAEVEKKQQDIYQLGLAKFAEKNFSSAAELFRKSGETKVKRLKKTQTRKRQLEEKEKKLTDEIVRDFRKEGDSHYADYQFKKALTAYERALQYVSKEEQPQLWHNLTIDIGNTNRDIGIRTKGAAIQEYLSAALEAYQRAGQAYKREEEPGLWANAQNGIGNALTNQGIRTGGEDGRRLLAEAVAAYRKALEIRTFEHLRPQWAQTQNNLAQAYTYLEDWPNAATCYANVLKVYPDYEEAYQTAGWLFHEVLFKYPEAYRLNQNWLVRHPQDRSAQMDFAEKHFTTERFAECEKRITALIANPEVESRVKIALRAIGMANLIALNKIQRVPDELETLITNTSAESDTFRVGWTFEGTKHFISTSDNEYLSAYRQWLLAFFQALEEENREAILRGLQEAQKKFQTMADKSK